MGLDVTWKSAAGDELGSFSDATNAFIDALANLSERDYPTLRRIDEYHTTHLPAGTGLVTEVARLRDCTENAAARGQLSHLLAMLRRAAETPGSYLEFLGD